MFGLFRAKEKELIIKAPVDGEIVEIASVPDDVFSQKLVGDGVAIDPKDNTFYSPVDGVITTIFPTKHAIGITTCEGIELMLHIGIETVHLNGEGFELYVNEGEKVKTGDKLLKIDIDCLRAKAKSLISPVIITNVDKVKKINISRGMAAAGHTVIMTVSH